MIRQLAERSLDALSETHTIFSFLSTAAEKLFFRFPSPFGEGARRAGEVFVYFLGLKPKSKSLSGLRTIR